MKKHCFYWLLICFGSIMSLNGQTLKGYVINIENATAYIDLAAPDVKVGYEVEIYTAGGYMTNPVTGRRVKKADKPIGTLEIISVHTDYSVARPIGSLSMGDLKVGMSVQLLKKKDTDTQTVGLPVQKSVAGNASSKPFSSVSSTSQNSKSSNNLREDKVTVVVAPAEVNDVVNSGHFGGYVADVLMEQLLMCNKVRLLDRSVLNAQLDEVNLSGDVIDPATAIQRGKVVGAHYIVQVTMQKPDVVNIRTGIPLASVMGAIGMATGKNMGAQYASNAQVGTLKAMVNISTRVIDLQTGEVLFMTSGTGKAEGKSQLSLEYGALGGAEVNGGADGFKQTVTGKAIQKAFFTIGRNLNDFFNGHTDTKVMGNASGYGNYGQQMACRGTKLYLGTEKLDKEGIQMAFADNQVLYFRYKNARRTRNLGGILLIGGIGLGVAGGQIVGDAGNGGSSYLAVGGGILIGGIGFALCNISARRSVKRIVNAYNYSQRKTANISLNVVSSGNNWGLRLIF